MKRVIYLGAFLALVGVAIVGCKKEIDSNAAQTSQTSVEKSTTIVNEDNVGQYHNGAMLFIINDLSGMSDDQIAIKLQSASYISGKLKEYCSLNSISLPSNDVLNASFKSYENTSLVEFTSNEAFSDNQEEILNACFAELDIVNSDFSKADELISFLNSNLELVKSQTASKGRTISIAVINQLIASTKLWIVDGNINFLDSHNFYGKAPKPSAGSVLGADGKGLGTSLLFGGWSTPIGWAGSLFVGAGASFGEVIDSNWWPF